MTMSENWVTVSQACDIYGVSRRTVSRWIKQGKVQSKLDNNRRLVLVTEEGHTGTSEGHDDSDMSQDMSQQALVEQLQTEVEYLRGELQQSRERSDTIILQLTRQLDQSQRLLEHHQEPWYRRWRRKRNPEGNDG